MVKAVRLNSADANLEAVKIHLARGNGAAILTVESRSHVDRYYLSENDLDDLMDKARKGKGSL